MAIPKSEARTKAWLQERKMPFIRAGRSFGLFDFWALDRKRLYLIQAKANQAPRKVEYARLKAFNRHPSNTVKWVFIWKAWAREPIIREVPSCR